MLNESFKIGHTKVTGLEGRRVVPMEIDMIKAEATNEDSHTCQGKADSQVVNVGSNGTNAHFKIHIEIKMKM